MCCSLRMRVECGTTWFELSKTKTLQDSRCHIDQTVMTEYVRSWTNRWPKITSPPDTKASPFSRLKDQRCQTLQPFQKKKSHGWMWYEEARQSGATADLRSSSYSAWSKQNLVVWKNIPPSALKLQHAKWSETCVGFVLASCPECGGLDKASPSLSMGCRESSLGRPGTSGSFPNSCILSCSASSHQISQSPTTTRVCTNAKNTYMVGRASSSECFPQHHTKWIWPVKNQDSIIFFVFFSRFA